MVKFYAGKLVVRTGSITLQSPVWWAVLLLLVATHQSLLWASPTCSWAAYLVLLPALGVLLDATAAVAERGWMHRRVLQRYATLGHPLDQVTGRHKYVEQAHPHAYKTGTSTLSSNAILIVRP